MPIINIKDLAREHMAAHDGRGKMNIGFAFKDYQGYGNDNGSGWLFFGVAEFPVGTTAGLHTHTNDDEFFYVLEGKAILIQDGEEHVAKKGDIILTRKGSTHGIKKVITPFKFITIEIPRRDG